MNNFGKFEKIAIRWIVLSTFRTMSHEHKTNGHEYKTMDDSSKRLNFYLGQKNEINHNSQNEHLKIRKMTKIDREMF